MHRIRRKKRDDKMKTETRLEADSIGTMEVPAEAYYGVQALSLIHISQFFRKYRLKCDRLENPHSRATC